MHHLADGTLRIAPVDVHLDEETVVQPDIFWVAPESQCRLVDGKCWHGTPDLVGEMFVSSLLGGAAIEVARLLGLSGA